MSSVLVPFANVDAENKALKHRLLLKLGEVFDGGAFIGGEEVEVLEERFAHLHGCDHAVAVNSGTDALRLVMRALGLERGAQAVTVANTFVATVGAMVSEGLKPALVDVGDDENMDADALAAAIGPRTQAVVAVHLRGLPADVEAIRHICAARGLALIEDCAQSVSASVGGQVVGGFGIAGCFSLHPLKNLGACGDGGMIVTRDGRLAEELRLLRNHGLQGRDTVLRWGENSRLDSIQAAMLNIKLDQLEQWTARRQYLAQRYDEGLAGLPLTSPPAADGQRTHVYHRYVIRLPDRDALRDHLAGSGIETAIHYPVPIHRQPAAARTTLALPAGGLPVTEGQATQILSLPLHPALRDEQIDLVVQEIHTFFDRGSNGGGPW